MKKIIIASALIILISLQAKAQDDVKTISQKIGQMQTTKAEYDYMMHDFQQDQKAGKPVKEGYRLVNEYKDIVYGYTFTARDLIRSGPNQYVGTMIHVKAPDGKEEYIALPYMNESLMNIYRTQLDYILRNKRLSIAYSKFSSQKMAASASVRH